MYAASFMWSLTEAVRSAIARFEKATRARVNLFLFRVSAPEPVTRVSSFLMPMNFVNPLMSLLGSDEIFAFRVSVFRSNFTPQWRRGDTDSVTPGCPCQEPTVETSPRVTLNLNGTGGRIAPDIAVWACVKKTPARRGFAGAVSFSESFVLRSSCPRKPNGRDFAGTCFRSTASVTTILTYFETFEYFPDVMILRSSGFDESKLKVPRLSPMSR